MDSFRRDMLEALRIGRVMYYKRQEYLLRPMEICGRLEIPNVRSECILGLFATSGSNKIYIHDFLEEYFSLVHQAIKNHINGCDEQWPEIVDYALEKDYGVVFQKGDIVRNQYYDPSVTQVEEAS